ncbi:glycosyltransferase 1 domain containing 1 [Halocaridina rubra]|uniref:Glycosyltransferase 1 domain containing 1 n=1 Tax=Halocaridina rubra TaxID=373956 RepID=A0AAN9A345_HALRR
MDKNEQEVLKEETSNRKEIHKDNKREEEVEDREEQRSCIVLVGKHGLRETGNAATLYRLRDHVISGSYTCVLIDPGDVNKNDPASEVISIREQYKISAIVGIHLYRSSSVLLKCKELDIPVICYFGGTDVNENIRDPQKLNTMTKVAAAATYLIAFNGDMKRRALSLWPFLKDDTIKILPQAVTVEPDQGFECYSWIRESEKSFYSTVATTSCVNNENEDDTPKGNKSHPFHAVADIEYQNLENQRKWLFDGRPKKNDLSFAEVEKCPSCSSIFNLNAKNRRLPLPEEYNPLVVLVAGLRPVKDVMYVADAWSEWQGRQGKGKMIIIGPTLDDDYTRNAMAHARRLNGIIITDKLSPTACQAVIFNATVVINTSLSEGMSAAILEAMALGKPVLARNIPGNAAIIKHGVNGLLFNTPEDFVKELEHLQQNPELVETMTTNLLNYLHSNHCPEMEKKSLLQILRDTETIATNRKAM